MTRDGASGGAAITRGVEAMERVACAIAKGRALRTNLRGSIVVSLTAMTARGKVVLDVGLSGRACEILIPTDRAWVLIGWIRGSLFGRLRGFLRISISDKLRQQMSKLKILGLHGYTQVSDRAIRRSFT